MVDTDLHLTFEEARELVLLPPTLGEEYHALLQRAFDERWIDVYGKQASPAHFPAASMACTPMC